MLDANAAKDFMPNLNKWEFTHTHMYIYGDRLTYAKCVYNFIHMLFTYTVLYWNDTHRKTNVVDYCEYLFVIGSVAPMLQMK